MVNTTSATPVENTLTDLGWDFLCVDVSDATDQDQECEQGILVGAGSAGVDCALTDFTVRDYAGQVVLEAWMIL